MYRALSRGKIEDSIEIVRVRIRSQANMGGIVVGAYYRLPCQGEKIET